MRSATATNRKITWLAREDSAGTLDLSPAFQRRPVWTEEQASYLIDTILNNLPFPEIYIRSNTSPDGKTSYEVVDGQQRVRSILEFSQNNLSLSGKELSSKWINKTFENLSDQEKTSFWNYEVVTRELNEASDGEIRDLFRRLNINAVTLNDQELRHAKYKGEFISLMEELAEDEWWLDNRIVNIRQIRRMEDVEFVSELFVLLMAGPQDKKKTLDDYYSDYENSFPEKHILTKKFKLTRDIIYNVIGGEGIKSWSGKSDFYSLFHLFCHLSEKIPFTKENKINIREELKRIRISVDQAKRRDNKVKYPKDIVDYADAVTRAATDVARRKARFEILLKKISNIIKK